MSPSPSPCLNRTNDYKHTRRGEAGAAEAGAAEAASEAATSAQGGRAVVILEEEKGCQRPAKLGTTQPQKLATSHHKEPRPHLTILYCRYVRLAMYFCVPKQ